MRETIAAVKLSPFAQRSIKQKHPGDLRASHRRER
jgi:hypothetical protein